jgi:hypothetical protein
MRQRALAAVVLMLSASVSAIASCAAPPSDGGLWSRQAQEQEIAMSRLTEDQRQATAQAFELRVADEALDQQQLTLQSALERCPGATPTIDTNISRHIAADAVRQARLAQQAQVVAYLQQAATTGSGEACQQARTALGQQTTKP